MDIPATTIEPAAPSSNKSSRSLYLNVAIVSVDHSKRELVYRLEVKTNLNQYPQKILRDVERTYPEFVRLHGYLVLTYPELLVPVIPPPPTHNIGPLPLDGAIESRGIGLDDGLSLTDPTRQDLQSFLTRLSEHRVLRKDLELQNFFQSSFLYTTPHSGNRQGQNGLSGMSHYRPLNDDKVYGTLRSELVRLETSIQTVATGMGAVFRGRRLLARGLLDGGAKLISIGVGGAEDPLLASALRRVGKGLQVHSELQHHAADLEAGPLLMRYFELHSRQVAYLQDQLAHRFNVQLELESARRRAEASRHALVVLKAAPSLKQERVTAALEDFEEDKKLETYREGQAERLTTQLPIELERFEKERVEDGRDHLLRYAQHQLILERHALEPFLAALPDLNQLKRQVHQATYTTAHPSPPQRDPFLQASSVNPLAAASLLKQ